MLKEFLNIELSFRYITQYQFLTSKSQTHLFIVDIKLFQSRSETMTIHIKGNLNGIS